MQLTQKIKKCRCTFGERRKKSLIEKETSKIKADDSVRSSVVGMLWPFTLLFFYFQSMWTIFCTKTPNSKSNNFKVFAFVFLSSYLTYPYPETQIWSSRRLQVLLPILIPIQVISFSFACFFVFNSSFSKLGLVSFLLLVMFLLDFLFSLLLAA